MTPYLTQEDCGTIPVSGRATHNTCLNVTKLIDLYFGRGSLSILLFLEKEKEEENDRDRADPPGASQE